MWFVGACLMISACFAHPYNAPITCTGQNEHYFCGSECDNVCEYLHKQNQTNCPIVNIVCNDKCYCDEGYARDENNECIPIKDCKPPKCAGVYEHYNDCADLGTVNCAADICGQRQQRGIECATPCKPGCKCDYGYLRLEEGSQCIPQYECPEKS